jgi:hypothetical protein
MWSEELNRAVYTHRGSMILRGYKDYAISRHSGKPYATSGKNVSRNQKKPDMASFQF